MFVYFFLLFYCVGTCIASDSKYEADQKIKFYISEGTLKDNEFEQTSLWLFNSSLENNTMQNISNYLSEEAWKIKITGTLQFKNEDGKYEAVISRFGDLTLKEMQGKFKNFQLFFVHQE